MKKKNTTKKSGEKVIRQNNIKIKRDKQKNIIKQNRNENKIKQGNC
jgi:hypothetical protein